MTEAVYCITNEATPAGWPQLRPRVAINLANLQVAAIDRKISKSDHADSVRFGIRNALRDDIGSIRSGTGADKCRPAKGKYFVEAETFSHILVSRVDPPLKRD